MSWPSGSAPRSDDEISNRIELRMLVLSADGAEPEFTALVTALGTLGVPHDTLIATEARLTSDMLSPGPGQGRYQAVLLATSNLAFLDPDTGQWRSAFSDEEWATLLDYEARFAIRQVTANTFPGQAGSGDLGLVLNGVHESSAGQVVGQLTEAGREVFSYLQPDAQITFADAHVYLASAVSSDTVPLVVTGEGDVVVSVRTSSDGRESMALMAANAVHLTHWLLLSYGVIHWAARGLFVGERHVHLGVHVDDVFIGNRVWDVAARAESPTSVYRLSDSDVRALAAWQSEVNGRSEVTEGLRLELAFVGSAAIGHPSSELVDEVRRHQAAFGWVSHTWDHRTLDDIPYDEGVMQVVRNEEFAELFGFTHFHSDSLVQSDVSGLGNGEFLRAAADIGIRFLVADTSQPAWAVTTGTESFSSPFAPQIVIVPRRPTGLFCNVTTPQEWVSAYNHYYGSDGVWARGEQDWTYDEILDRESEVFLRYLLRWDAYPLMFHQANLRAYDGQHSLLTDLLDAVLTKYTALSRVPVRSLMLHDLGAELMARREWSRADVRATLDSRGALTVVSPVAVTVPVTGVSDGARTEVYGTERITYVDLEPDVPVTLGVATRRSQTQRSHRR